MKLKFFLSLMAIAAAMNVSANEVKKDNFYDKTISIFTFKGCVIVVDYPNQYHYTNIFSTTMSTTNNTVNLYVNGNNFQKRLNEQEKDLFVKEYVYRQNYCSFIR